MVHYPSVDAALQTIREMHNYDGTELTEVEYCRTCGDEVSGTVVDMDDHEVWFVCDDAHVSRIDD